MCHPPPPSPIIINVAQREVRLTSAAEGVVFDLAGNGYPFQIGWTAAGSMVGFLALDRNKDGKISSGKELFGNFTDQPSSDDPNGFLALAEYDKADNGGDGNGFIDDRDSIFQQLMIWIDSNHDGVSQPDELKRLHTAGVYSIDLSYSASRRTDRYGNEFRFRSAVNKEPGDHRGSPMAAYDVFFVTGSEQKAEQSLLQPTSFSVTTRCSVQNTTGVVPDQLNLDLTTKSDQPQKKSQPKGDR